MDVCIEQHLLRIPLPKAQRLPVWQLPEACHACRRPYFLLVQKGCKDTPGRGKIPNLPPPRIVPLSISRFPSGSRTFSRGICRLGKGNRETGNGGCSRRSPTALCRLPPPADPDLQGFFRLKGAPSSCRPLAVNRAKEAGQGGISPHAQPISTARAPAGWPGITGLIPAGQTCPAAGTPYPYISPG